MRTRRGGQRQVSDLRWGPGGEIRDKMGRKFRTHGSVYRPMHIFFLNLLGSLFRAWMGMHLGVPVKDSRCHGGGWFQSGFLLICWVPMEDRNGGFSSSPY